MRNISQLYRKFYGIICIGLSWGVIWAILFAIIVVILGFLDPADIGPDEGPIPFSGIGFIVGCVSGTIFGVILIVAESRKPILELNWMRIAIWGSVGAAAWPLMTPLPDMMMLILCPIGALCATGLVALARRANAHDQGAGMLSFISRLMALPIRLACSSRR